MSAHFGRHEQVLSRDATLADGEAQFGLGVIHLGAVQMAVPQSNRSFDRFDQIPADGSVLSRLVPGGAGAITELDRRQSKSAEKTGEGLTMGMETASFRLTEGFGGAVMFQQRLRDSQRDGVKGYSVKRGEEKAREKRGMSRVHYVIAEARR